MLFPQCDRSLRGIRRHAGMFRTQRVIACTSEWLESRRMFSAAGDVDASFGVGGKIVGSAMLQQNALHSLNSHAIAIDSSGRIIVAGSVQNGDQQHMLVVRYLATGALDTSFGTGGYREIDFGATYPQDSATSVAIDSAGRIVAAGTGGNPTHRDFGVARLTSTGALDSSFSGDGKMLFDFGQDEAVANAVAIGPDDRVVVAGYSQMFGGDSQIAVARITTSGRLDTGFSVDGKQTIDASTGNDAADAVAVLADNRVVMAGYLRDDAGNYEFAVVRLTSAGQLDKTFDQNGIAAASFGGTEDTADSLLVTPDGRYIAAGYSRQYSQYGYLTATIGVASFTSNGSPDDTFGTNGLSDSGTWDDGGFFDYNPQGPVTIAPSPPGGYRLVMDFQREAQLKSDGSYDSTFGVPSLPYPNYPVDISGFGGAIVRQDGSLILAENVGYYYSSNALNGLFDTFQLIAAKPDASPDTKFNAAGHGTLLLPSTIDTIGVEVDGKLIVAGRDASGDFFQRYNSSGKIDTGFGGGRVEAGNIQPTLDPLSLIIRADGGFYAYGAYVTYDPNGVALRIEKLNADGTFDPNFNDDNYVGSETDEGTIALLSGGYLSIHYEYYGPNYPVAVLVRPNGTYTFASLPQLPGHYVSENGNDPQNVYPAGIGGAFIVQGIDTYQDENGVGHEVPLIAKYAADGSLESTFGSAGIVYGTFSILDVQRDGKALYFANELDTTKGLKRLGVNGASDGTFGTSGVAGAGFKHFALDSRGRIIAWKQLSGGNVQIERFTADGKPDSTFGGGDGIVSVQPAVNGTANVVITPKDDLVVTTLNRSGSSAKWSATRLLGGGFAGIAPNQALIVGGSSSDDTITLTASGKNINCILNDKTQSFVKTSIKSVIINGYGGNDVITVGSGIGAVAINGGDGDDVIHGGAGNDTLIGGPGRDQLFGEAGNDLFYTKDGRTDLVDGGAGFDTAQRDNGPTIFDQVMNVEKFI